jgi:hypothetical protein
MAIASDGRIVTAGTRKGAHARLAIVERRFDGTCGNATPEPGEDCDGGSGCDVACCLADADGDGLCDAVDPCTSPQLVDRVRLRVAAGRAGRMLTGAMRLSGSMAVRGAFDPMANGVRVLVGPSLDVTIPGGPYDPDSMTGWTFVAHRSALQWSYRNRSGAPPEGVTRLTIREITSGDTPTVRFELQGGDGRYVDLAANPSLVAGVVLDPGRVLRVLCGEARFSDDANDAHCRVKQGGGALACH